MRPRGGACARPIRSQSCTLRRRYCFSSNKLCAAASPWVSLAPGSGLLGPTAMPIKNRSKSSNPKATSAPRNRPGNNRIKRIRTKRPVIIAEPPI